MKTAIIDCRSFDQFKAGHHKHACNLASHQLLARMHELPDKNTPICLIGDTQSLKSAQAFFNEKQYDIESSKVWDEAFITAVKAADNFAIGTESARLWQPSNIVQQLIDITPHKKPLTALDIASGAGRDAVFMALQGFNVTAIDYNPDAIKRCKSLAKYNHVAVTAIEKDIEKPTVGLSFIEGNSVDILTVCRYLHRPLFNDIKRILKPGGLIAYHTFMVGSEKFGSPKNPNYLLKETELAETFSDFTIIENRIEYLNDGRPTSFFIAQKP